MDLLKRGTDIDPILQMLYEKQECTNLKNDIQKLRSEYDVHSLYLMLSSI